MDNNPIFQSNSSQDLKNDQATPTPVEQNIPPANQQAPNIPPPPLVQAPAVPLASSPEPSSPPQDPVPPVGSPPPPPVPVEDMSMPPDNSIFDVIKNNLLKIIIGVVVFIVFIFLIFGLLIPNLGKNKNQKVTLTYWGLWEDSNVMQGIISEFERQNPNITINYSKQDPSDYRQRLATRIANGTGPDIFRFHNSWYPMLSSVLLPLPESVISKSDFSKNFFSVAQSDLIKNGAIYGIPLEIDTLSLYINTDLFKSAGISPPKDWTEFRDDAKSLTVKDTSGTVKTAGAAIGTYSNVSHAPDIISLLAVQNGANFSNLTNYTNEVSDALRFYTSFGTGDSNVWDSTLDNSILNFSKGNVAMIFGYSWDFFTIKSLNPNLQCQVLPVPQLDPNNPYDIASYWVEGVSSKTTHQKEAELFMHFLAQKDTQQQLYTEEAKTRTFGEPYSNVSLVQSLKSDPNVAPFVGQANFAVSSYFVDNTNDNGLNAKLNTYMGNAVNSIITNTSPESATATLFQGYDQVLKEYGQ